MAEEEKDRWPNDEEERETAGRTPGGVEPLSGERPADESQNADIPAGR